MGPLSGGSKPTFCRARGMVEADGAVLLGTPCACKVQAASRHAAIPAQWRSLFIALFLVLHSWRRPRRQTLFGNHLHRVPDWDLRDPAAPIDPFELFIGLRVVIDCLTQ